MEAMSEPNAAQRIEQALLGNGRKTTIINNYVKDAQKHYELAYINIRREIEEAANRALHDLPAAERKAASANYAKSYLRGRLEKIMTEIDRL
jgi:hypothetical protein